MVSPAGRKALVYTGLSLGLLSSRGPVSVPGAGAGLSNQCGESCGVQHPEPTPLLGRGWGSGVHPSPGVSGGGGISGTGEAGGPSLLGPGPLSGYTSPQLQHLPHGLPRYLNL